MVRPDTVDSDSAAPPGLRIGNGADLHPAFARWAMLCRPRCGLRRCRVRTLRLIKRSKRTTRLWRNRPSGDTSRIPATQQSPVRSAPGAGALPLPGPDTFADREADSLDYVAGSVRGKRSSTV